MACPVAAAYDRGLAAPGCLPLLARALILLRLRRALGLGRLGQRRGIVGQAVEIGDDVRPLAPARDTGEGHVGAWDRAPRIEDELAELVDRPVAALALERRRIVEARLRGLRPADD